MNRNAPGHIYVTFSIDAAETRELRRLAKRLGFREPRALAGDLFRIGLDQCGARFEPTTRFGRVALLREALNASRPEQTSATRRRTRRASTLADHEGRRDRLSRGH